MPSTFGLGMRVHTDFLYVEKILRPYLLSPAWGRSNGAVNVVLLVDACCSSTTRNVLITRVFTAATGSPTARRR